MWKSVELLSFRISAQPKSKLIINFADVYVYTSMRVSNPLFRMEITRIDCSFDKRTTTVFETTVNRSISLSICKNFSRWRTIIIIRWKSMEYFQFSTRELFWNCFEIGSKLKHRDTVIFLFLQQVYKFSIQNYYIDISSKWIRFIKIERRARITLIFIFLQWYT